MNQLTAALYERLRGSLGCGVASIGFERDRFPLSDIQADWADYGRDGFNGLVVERRFTSILPSSLWMHFDDEHEWMPFTPILHNAT